jgi:hypothetical protein
MYFRMHRAQIYIGIADLPIHTRMDVHRTGSTIVNPGYSVYLYTAEQPPFDRRAVT